jgi:signal transduction histidine kinase/CheY-like chemotaxis protein/HPt (histidine-containing phosphotransfer) domain-containing protein
MAMVDKSFLSPLRGKIIAAFLLACVAIALAVGTTYIGFNSLLDQVDELTVPNDKLRSLNNLFEQITRLDQQQRADAIRNPGKSYRAILQESKQLTATLDTLIAMPWSNTRQPTRLEAMKRVVAKRDYLLVEYLRLRSEFVSNKKFSQQLDSLSLILAEANPQPDSTVTTNENKKTTTTYIPEEKKRNFFSRLFGGKKKDSVSARVEIKEETLTRIDTLAIAKQNGALDEVENIMKRLNEDQRLQTQEMMQRELRLINTNMALINQLLSILREVETEELTLFENKNAEAGLLVNKSVKRISIIIAIFFLVAAALVFMMLIDISRSNYYRLQLTQAKEEAERLSLVKQRFLANMSHEIRTPLQSILGFTEQLNAQRNNAESLLAIQQSSEHLLHIVDEVLDYSRIESRQFVLDKSPLWLDELVDEVATVVTIQAKQKNLSFHVEIDQIDSPVLGDAFRLKQVFYNLLGNAIKFTAEGSITFNTRILEQTDTFIKTEFRISDTGKGIPKDEQEIIFNQFEQGGKNIHRQYGGAGLGLSIVKKIIDQQQGIITVESEVGSGTTFSISLTLEKTEAPVINPVRQIQPTTFSGHVWLVDDDPLILKLCSLILDKKGIPYTALQSSPTMLEQKLNSNDVVFLDIRMPGINGVELCKQLRTRVPELYIVALTAHLLPDERKFIVESGFNRILPKPFREIEFLDALNQNKLTQEAEVNLSELEKMTHGDKVLMNSIVEEFMEETHKNVLQLEKRMLDKDAAGAREIIHQLAGRVGQFGGRPVMKELQHIEQLLAGDVPLHEIKELPQVLQQVKQLQTELSKGVKTSV